MRKNNQEGYIEPPDTDELFKETCKVIEKLVKLIPTSPLFRKLRNIKDFWYDSTHNDGEYHIRQHYGNDLDLYGESELDYLAWLESEVFRITHTWDMAEELTLLNKDIMVYRSERLRIEYNLYAKELAPTGLMINVFNYWSRLLKMIEDYNESISNIDMDNLSLH